MKEVLKEVISKIKLNDNEIKEIKKLSKAVFEEIKKRIEKKKIKASVFVGGSLAKNTLVNTKIKDVDLFVRFDNKYSEEEISKLLNKIFFLFRIRGHKIKVKKIHGSRDYYRIIFLGKNIEIEVIPSVEISKPQNARNVTDLSYFHVKYIKSKLEKNSKLSDQIIIAKAFCHAAKCYGAESFIKGFSGYAIELLIIAYKDFEKFICAMSKQNNKLVIDYEKKYASGSQLLHELNPSKLTSPIILIDPTNKERNACASLSKETFEKFKNYCQKFIENPSIDFFEEKKINVTDLKKEAYEKECEFLALELKTNKQEGDIAGTKLAKANKFYLKKLNEYFSVEKNEFDYNIEENKGSCYFILKRRKEIIIKGPNLKYKEGVENFKKKHPIWYIKNEQILSAKNKDLTIKEIVQEINKKYYKIIKEMGVISIKIYF